MKKMVKTLRFPEMRTGRPRFPDHQSKKQILSYHPVNNRQLFSILKNNCDLFFLFEVTSIEFFER